MLTFCISLISLSSFADYPIFAQRYTADPYHLVHNGRLYLFCSHDVLKRDAQDRPERGYIMRNITCISTDDMKNWTDHGEVFDVKDSKWGAKLSWAPAIVERNRKFYLYYGDGMESIGVAVSNSPTGPFIDTNDGPIVDKKTPGVMEGSGGRWGMWCFDPGILIDDDGQAYMYFGGSDEANFRVIKLKENMVEVDGPAVKIDAPGFFEAAFTHKYNGKYYMSYAGHHFSKPANIEYVMSDKPMEGFSAPLLAMTNPPVNDGFNHHHSIFEFKGKWYMAYHNRQVAHTNKIEEQPLREFTRSVCIDELFYNEDGTIKEVIPTVDGIKQLKYVDPYVDPFKAVTMAMSSGINTADNGKGGRYVSEISNNDWIQIKGVDFGALGAGRFMANVACGGKGGSIELRLGDPKGIHIGTCRIENTGGNDNWEIKSAFVNNAVGVRDLFLVFKGEGDDIFRLDTWQFERKQAYHTNKNNPIIQTHFTADPAPMVYKDTLYLYTSHDEDNAPENRFLMKDYRLYTTTDMVNWTDRGTPLKTTDFVWSAGDANAAQCIERDGKFYWYVSIHSTTDQGVAVGVAVADNPLGPFVDPLGKPIITNSQTKFAKHSWDDLDPTAFVDDDGQAYMFWGNNALYWVKLNDDMISYSGEINALDIFDKSAFGPDFEEGPWVYKRNGLYYMHYPSGSPESLHYTTAKNIEGPWTYGGLVMPHDGGKSGTNHPGVIDYKGNSYFFYHNADLPGCHDKRRAICVEQFTYNADGSISQIEDTKTGILKPVGSLNPFKKVQAETIAFSEGLKTKENKEVGVYVSSIHHGDYIKVRNVNFGNKKAKSFSANVASAGDNGSIEIRLGSHDGTLVGTLPVASTGSLDQWKIQTANVEGVKGAHDVFFVFKGNSADELFNFDHWVFK